MIELGMIRELVAIFGVIAGYSAREEESGITA